MTKPAGSPEAADGRIGYPYDLLSLKRTSVNHVE